MERDGLIPRLRRYGYVDDLSGRTDIALTNMVDGYRQKGAKELYHSICPYFLGVAKYDAYHWKIGCARKSGCDITPLDRKNWAETQARSCLQPKGADFQGYTHCRFFCEAQKESEMKQTYICKCGIKFEAKDGSSATTGNRFGADFAAGHGCYGCPFVVEVMDGLKIVDHECRASKTVRYDTTADLPHAREGFHVGRIYTLDLQFAQQIWDFSRSLEGLECREEKIDMRGADFGSDGRYCLTLYLQKTKAGVASALKISEKFFAGGTARPGMTEAQEKELVLQQIRQSISAANRPVLTDPPSAESPVSNGVQSSRSIEQITLEINFYKQQTAQNIVEIGKRLNEAKAQLQHGEWLPWLRDRVQFTERSAQNFMRIAEEFSKTKPVADLPYTKLLALLQVPEDAREEFIQETHLVDGQGKTVSDMSKRELEKVIRERDEAKKAEKSERERAKREYDNYMDALVKLEKTENNLNTLRTSREYDIQKINNLEKQVQDLANRPVEVAVEKPGEDAKRQLRDEGAAAARRQYEQQLADARRQLEAAKSSARQEIGLTKDQITCAAASFRDSLDSICDNFQLILQLSPAGTLERISRECIDHMRGLVHELEEASALARNASLMDEDFDLPPEDGQEE